MTYTIGIDISKTHLDAFRQEDQAAQQFENTPRGIRALIRWLGQTPVARIVFEPTGPYHRAFEAALAGKFPLVKVNPRAAHAVLPKLVGRGPRLMPSMRAFWLGWGWP